MSEITGSNNTPSLPEGGTPGQISPFMQLVNHCKVTMVAVTNGLASTMPGQTKSVVLQALVAAFAETMSEASLSPTVAETIALRAALKDKFEQILKERAPAIQGALASLRP